MKPEPGNRTLRWVPVLLLFLLFALPLFIAAWLYYGGSIRPAGQTNHGIILEPIANLRDAVPNSAAVGWSDAHWLLIYANDDRCGADCRRSLYTMRQIRLMLGKDMHRLRRVFLHGDAPPDRVLIEEQHQGLNTLKDNGLSALLAARRPQGVAAGGYFLVDPLGNLVMYFPPDIVPGDMADDIEHLLDLSRIG